MAVNVEMPFHKARELMAPYRNAMPLNQPMQEVDNEPPEPPNVLVDAASLGGPSGPGQKPLARHVLVKDLNKIATRMKLEPPKTGVFSNKAPMGLYALFDGQSCTGDPGAMAAEFCARNFHTKLLKRLAELPDEPDQGVVQAALVRTFDDLDKELLHNQPEITDGCGAAVCLLIGQIVFSAVLGQCVATLCQAEKGSSRFVPVKMGGGQGIVDADVMRIRFAGGMIYGEGPSARIRHPLGQDSAVSRSLGDRMWKDLTSVKSPLVVSTPEVHCVALRSADEHPFLLLGTSTMASVMSLQDMVDVAGECLRQPRAACGELATKALAARAGTAQCTAVNVSFLPPRSGDNKRPAPGTAGPAGPPSSAAKKAKVANARGGTTQSIRLRHIMVRFQDAPGKDGKKLLRSRQDAETLLRQALFELKAEVKALKKTPKDATELVTVTSKKFAELSRKTSECESAKKGGAMSGDLGWMNPDELANFGGSFREVMEVLLPGQFSDIAVSDSCLHLAQRVA